MSLSRENKFSSGPKIKVIFAINDFIVGGAQRVTAELARALDRDQFEPQIVTLFDFPGQPDLYASIPADVPVRRFAFTGFHDWRSWWHLYRWLVQVRPAVVVSSLFFSNTVFRLLALVVGFVCLPCEHNTYINKPWWQRQTDRLLALVSPRIIAVSATVADFTARQENLPLERFIIIRNGIDLAVRQREAAGETRVALRQALGYEPTEKILLNVARLTPQKNHRALIDGFALFAPSHPSYRLVIVGGGNLLESLRAEVNSRGLAGRISLVGPRKDVWKF